MSVLTNQFSTQNRKLLGILTTGHLVNDLYGVTLPFLLPIIITNFSLSFFQAGLLSIATSLLSGILQPIVGYLADKYAQRKLVMRLGFVAFGSGLFLAGVATSFPLLVVAFFVFGLGQATFHAQSTNLITTAFPTAKGRAMGIHGIGGSIGNFTAPILITFLIGLTSWRNATLMLTLPALLVFILLGFWLTEPPRPKKVDEKKFSFSAHLLFLALNFGLIYMVYVGFLTFLPTYLVENGATLEQAGRISAFMLFVGFFAQPLGGLIYDKLGGRFLFGASSLLASLGLFLFTSGTFLPVVVTIALIGVAATATFPVTLAMASEIAKGNNVGASVGFVFGVSGVLSSFAPALTGYTADSLGLLQSFRLLIVLAGLAFVVAFFLPKQKLEA